MDESLLRRFRMADPDDTPALARLLAVTPEIAESGEDISEDALRAQHTWPGHQPERDRLVVEAPGHPGELVGYASVFKTPETPRADVQVVVHPAWRRRGLGATLMRRALDDARALGAAETSVYAHDADTAAGSFALAQGFAPVAAYIRLSAPGDMAFPAPDFPAGYTVRACRGMDDLALFIESANACYAGLWGHQIVRPEDERGWFETLDPAGVCFLFGPDAALVGRGLAQRIQREGRPTGYLDAPGVIPAQRGAGLYVPLLLWGARWLTRHPDGAVTRYLLESWGDDPAIIAAYQGLGFTLDRREIAYRLALRP